MTLPDAPRTPVPDDPRQAPLVVALLGAIAVIVLLVLPVHAKDPDPTWSKPLGCGSGWYASESDWHTLNEEWRQEAATACGEKRGDRLAQLGTTVAATLFAVTFVLALPRRRRSQVEVEQEPETA